VYVDIGVSTSISNLHNWEVCLIAIQTSQGQYPLVNVLDSRDVQLVQDNPVIAQYLVFNNPDGSQQVTLYWYEKASFNAGFTVEQKYVRISLIILRQNSTDYSKQEQELLAVGKQIAAKWAPMETQALVSLGIPAQEALLIASVVFLVVTATGQFLAQQRKAANNLRIFNSFASQKEKIMLRTVREQLKERKYLRTSDIIEGVQKSRSKPVNPRSVLQVLAALEKNGFIKRTIVSIDNSPLQVWKL
jgi:hypothetical protein